MTESMKKFLEALYQLYLDYIPHDYEDGMSLPLRLGRENLRGNILSTK